MFANWLETKKKIIRYEIKLGKIGIKKWSKVNYIYYFFRNIMAVCKFKLGQV